MGLKSARDENEGTYRLSGVVGRGGKSLCSGPGSEFRRWREKEEEKVRR